MRENSLLRASRRLALTFLLLGVWTTQGCGASSAAESASLRAPEAAVGARALSKRVPWLEGAVVYGVVPPLFGSERPFNAVTAKLDYLKAQGVDALWLSPINATDDPSTISYGVTDYFDVRADFGTKADFKRLVAEAHRRKMRVLMDFVPNHTSTGHAFYQDAVSKGPASPYFNWYVRDKEGNAQHYFNWETLKNLNFDHPDMQRHMRDAFAYWVREMDVDGFRVDAAWGVKDRTPTFWPTLERDLRKLKPDVFLLAEASARDPYYVRNGFDSAYDWTKSLGKWSWENVWKDPAQTGAKLRRALAHRETPPEQVARFLNNNDTGVRFISHHGPETQKVAAVLLHTLPGIPIVYTGEEVGAEFEPYEDPPPISWNDPHQLKPLYKRLAELRETMPALRRGDWTEVKASSTAVYAFVRDAGADGHALVVLNFGPAARVTLTLPERYRTGPVVDVLSGRALDLGGKSQSTTIELSAKSALVLSRNPSPDGR